MSSGALIAAEVHTLEVNSLAFNPHNPHLLATGSSDRTAALHDWRNLEQPLHVLEAHTDQVYQVRLSSTYTPSTEHDCIQPSVHTVGCMRPSLLRT